MLSLSAKRILCLRLSFVNRFYTSRIKTIDHGTPKEEKKSKEVEVSNVPKDTLDLPREPQKLIQLRSELIKKLDVSAFLLGIGTTIVDFNHLYEAFGETLVKEVGPYLSKKVEKFRMTRNNHLEEYWKNEHLETFLLKLEEHLMRNTVLREAFERKGIPVEDFLSFCIRVRKGKREGLFNFANPFEREEKMELDGSYREALKTFADERKKDCRHIVKILPKLKNIF